MKIEIQVSGSEAATLRSMARKEGYSDICEYLTAKAQFSVSVHRLTWRERRRQRRCSSCGYLSSGSISPARECCNCGKALSAKTDPAYPRFPAGRVKA